MELIDAIEGRRSIGRVGPEEPPREDIEALLRAAVKAPNHRNNQPWRFFVLAGKAREHLGNAMGEGLRARLRDLEDDKAAVIIDGERAKPLSAPILIVVASKRSDDERIHPREDMQACSAAIQNMLLAAHDTGLAAQWRTRGAVNDAAVKEHLGLELRDEIAGFVYVGYPPEGYEANLKPRPREYAEFTQGRSS
jgi:nitroreductase